VGNRLRIHSSLRDLPQSGVTTARQAYQIKYESERNRPKYNLCARVRNVEEYFRQLEEGLALSNHVNLLFNRTVSLIFSRWAAVLPDVGVFAS
jgi:hypothetical protein